MNEKEVKNLFTLLEGIKNEVTLQDLAYQFGYNHPAAKQYTRLAHAIRMLDTCRWWECIRKHKIKKILIETINKIDNDSTDFYWENERAVKTKRKP